MRYALAVLTVIVAIPAVWLVSAGSWRPSSSPSAGAGPVAIRPTGLPSEPTPGIPDPSVLTRRENLIAGAKGMAKVMGEANPQLKDFRLTTIGALAQLLPGWDRGDIANTRRAASGTDDTPIYVVQLTGSFVPSSQPAGARIPPTPGVLTLIYDSKTGRQIASSFP